MMAMLCNLARQAAAMPQAAWMILLASAGALGAALVAQYGFAVQPCVLCLAQRVPFALAIVFAAASLWKPGAARVLLGLCALAFLVNAGIAFFHTGVEQHWWLGTSGCALKPLGGADAQSLREQLLATAVAQCDVVAWTFLGLSMANWNVPFALALAGFAGFAAQRAARKESVT
jgi:disulfide bond formation protein DsbB